MATVSFRAPPAAPQAGLCSDTHARADTTMRKMDTVCVTEAARTQQPIPAGIVKARKLWTATNVEGLDVADDNVVGVEGDNVLQLEAWQIDSIGIT